MSTAPRSEKLFIDGPVGALEAIVEQATDTETAGGIVVLHPHPQHGGTLQNKVVHTLARAFVKLEFTALRINFRGTGQSAGEYDNGDGEVDDALAAAQWLLARNPDGPLWIAGFSFGAAVAIKAAVRSKVDGLITVAPAITRFASGLKSQPQCPWLIVQGDNDELVDIEETIEWVNQLEPGPELLTVSGGEHFFHGRLVELREAVMSFADEHSS